MLNQNYLEVFPVFLLLKKKIQDSQLYISNNWQVRQEFVSKYYDIYIPYIARTVISDYNTIINRKYGEIIMDNIDNYIHLIEEISLNAWPSHKMELYDGWLIHFSYIIIGNDSSCNIRNVNTV